MCVCVCVCVCVLLTLTEGQVGPVFPHVHAVIMVTISVRQKYLQWAVFTSTTTVTCIHACLYNYTVHITLLSGPPHPTTPGILQQLLYCHTYPSYDVPRRVCSVVLCINRWNALNEGLIRGGSLTGFTRSSGRRPAASSSGE